jgi:hypothetical protein
MSSGEWGGGRDGEEDQEAKPQMDADERRWGLLPQRGTKGAKV